MVQNEIKMRKPKSRELIHALVQDWRLYVLLLPVVLWFALWAYKPMGGLLIAFKRYDSSLGIWMSEFKGIDNFVNLVAGVNKEQFWQAFRNTFVINAYSLVFGYKCVRQSAFLLQQRKYDRALSGASPCLFPKFLGMHHL